MTSEGAPEVIWLRGIVAKGSVGTVAGATVVGVAGVPVTVLPEPEGLTVTTDVEPGAAADVVVGGTPETVVVTPKDEPAAAS